MGDLCDNCPTVSNSGQADGDGDGLLSEREIALGTDPDRADTDGDGFDDAFEDLMSEFGFDPLAPTLDADRDGLADRFEQTLGTSPREPDTDEDGWGDLDEVMNASYGYDPLRTTVDADFDGLADALEAELGLSTENPNTDGDHLGDFAEYAAGLDPAVPDRGGNLGELVGSTYSQAMAKALETVRLGGAFPATLAGELAWMVEWLDVVGPPAVREHLASIGEGLVERYG